MAILGPVPKLSSRSSATVSPGSIHLYSFRSSKTRDCGSPFANGTSVHLIGPGGAGCSGAGKLIRNPDLVPSCRRCTFEPPTLVTRIRTWNKSSTLVMTRHCPAISIDNCGLKVRPLTNLKYAQKPPTMMTAAAVAMGPAPAVMFLNVSPVPAAVTAVKGSTCDEAEDHTFATIVRHYLPHIRERVLTVAKPTRANNSRAGMFTA